MPQFIANRILDTEQLIPEFYARRSKDERVKNARILEWIVERTPDNEREEFNHRLKRSFVIAEILDRLDVDSETIAAMSLQFTLLPDKRTKLAIEEEFGKEIAALVQGIENMRVIPGLSAHGNRPPVTEVNSENLRKMLISMVDDVRVVLVSLAARLQLLHSLKKQPSEERWRIAEQTLDLFAPLANRLGIWQFKWEMEDFALRYLEPETYRQIAAQLAEKRLQRERYIDAFIGSVQGELSKIGIRGTISGRPKHIYSIWRKMQSKGVDFDNIFDVRAIRVLVDSVADCYSALGAIHTHWSPIAGEFDDYIATPKLNNYQSIHTAVIGPKGKAVEVQIRTHEMHQENELGVAAHWRYKESLKRDSGIDNKVLWLRHLLEWKDEITDSEEFTELLKIDGANGQVYVFTPQGQVIDLPLGSTPIDFAYAIHTEVGHRCRGAKVNGRIVQLTYRLKNGEQVEILKAKKGGPSRDWLNTSMGYIASSRARSRISRWFKEQNFENNLQEGRSALEKELKRLGIDDVSYDKLAQKLKFKSTNDFLAAIGSGDVKLSQAVAPVKPRLLQDSVSEFKTTVPIKPRKREAKGLKVQGVGNLLTTMAHCCHPLPGDSIVGYITRTRGVTIHRQDCGNILRLPQDDRDRLVEVGWGMAEAEVYPVALRISGYDRRGFLHDVTTVFADAKINLLAVKLRTDESQHTACVDMTVEITDIEMLSSLLAKVSAIPNVTEVRRISH